MGGKKSGKASIARAASQILQFKVWFFVTSYDRNLGTYDIFADGDVITKLTEGCDQSYEL
jgi:hypothetical protein